MKLTTCGLACLLLSSACTEPKTGGDVDGAATSEPTAAPTPSETPSVEASATATATAAPTASAVADAPPAETPVQKFWSELAMAYNAKLEACKSGWTGDATITVKKGKIVAFSMSDAPSSKGASSVVGLAIPTVPAELEKQIAKPFTVSVCTATARLGSPE